MILEMLIRAFGVRAVAIVGDVFIIAPLMWALFKVSYQNVTGRAMPQTRLTTALDVAVEFMNNAPGAFNRARRAAGEDSIFKAPSGSPGGPTPPSVMMLCVAAFLLSCSPTRSLLVDANATLPRRGSCGVHRLDEEWCEGNVPTICFADEQGSDVARAWPLYGLDNDHNPSHCVLACRVLNNEAQCTDSQP